MKSTQQWSHIDSITASTQIGLYVMFFIWTMVHIKLYLIDQGRYKTLSVLIFYILAVAIELARIVQYFNILTIQAPVFASLPAFWQKPYLYNFFYVTSCYLKLILGFSQVQAMHELYTRIKLEPEAHKKIQRFKIGTHIVNFIVFVTMCVLSTWFMIVTYDNANCPQDDRNCGEAQFVFFMKIFGWISGTFYTGLMLGLIINYILFNRAITKVLGTSNQVSEILQQALVLFAVMVTSYILKTLLLYGQGNYRNLIHSWDLRIELQLILWPICDFLVIMPILIMHHKNFSSYKTTQDGPIEISEAGSEVRSVSNFSSQYEYQALLEESSQQTFPISLQRPSEFQESENL